MLTTTFYILVKELSRIFGFYILAGVYVTNLIDKISFIFFRKFDMFNFNTGGFASGTAHVMACADMEAIILQFCDPPTDNPFEGLPYLPTGNQYCHTTRQGTAWQGHWRYGQRDLLLVAHFYCCSRAKRVRLKMPLPWRDCPWVKL